MYTLSIEKIDGTRLARRGTFDELVETVRNIPDINEYWIEDEAGNCLQHWAHEENEENDGQPDEYTEWQDYMGGDDWDHGQYDDGGW